MLPSGPPRFSSNSVSAMKRVIRREAPVGERELADLVGVLGRDHLQEQLLVPAAVALDHLALVRTEADVLDEAAVAVERLGEADPALGSAPVGLVKISKLGMLRPLPPIHLPRRRA